MTKTEIIKRRIDLKRQYIELLKAERFALLEIIATNLNDIEKLESELMQLPDTPWPEAVKSLSPLGLVIPWNVPD